MMICYVGIEIKEKEVKKIIQPEISVERPKYSEDTGELIGMKKVVTQKEVSEYCFYGVTGDTFKDLMFKLKKEGHCLFYAGWNSFGMGESIAYVSSGDSIKIDVVNQAYERMKKKISRKSS